MELMAAKASLHSVPYPTNGNTPVPSSMPADKLWAALDRAEPDIRQARQNRVVAFARNDPAQASFDVLRTKLFRSLKTNGWKSVAITSPDPGCGKSVVAANLAISLSNLQNCRVVLMDLDFRRPQISAMLGPAISRPTAAFLEGKSPVESAFVRYRDNLAVSASNTAMNFPAELLQSQATRAAMLQLCDQLNPDVILFDLPPILGSDDVLGFLPNVDCTLLVAAAGQTSMAQLRSCEQELAAQTALLGVILNKCRHAPVMGYY